MYRTISLLNYCKFTEHQDEVIIEITYMGKMLKNSSELRHNFSEFLACMQNIASFNVRTVQIIIKFS